MSDPYQTPIESLLNDSDLTRSELRNRYRQEEAKVIAVGGVYYLLGSLLLSAGGVGAWYCAEKSSVFNMLPCGAAILIGCMFIVIGYGLRRLDSWARVPASIAAGVALFLFPIGTVVGLLCIAMLRRNAVREMFNPAYQTAIYEEGDGYDHFGWIAILVGLVAGAGTWLFLLLIVA